MADHAAIMSILAVNGNKKVLQDIEVLSVQQEDMEIDNQGLDSLIKLDISGQSFTVSQNLVNKYRTSKLARSKELESHWSNELQAHYFDRDPALFNAVLNILRYNALIVPPGYDTRLVMEEVAFWDVPYHRRGVEETEEESLEKEFQALENRSPPPEETDSQSQKWRYSLWCFITDPFSPHTRFRKLSLAYSFITISAVFFYLVVHGMSTSVYFRVQPEPPRQTAEKDRLRLPDISTTPSTRVSGGSGGGLQNDIDNRVLQLDCTGDDKMACYLSTKAPVWIDHTKLAMIALFTMETLLRLVLCPDLAYFKSIINWLDIIATGCAVAVIAVGRYLAAGNKTREIGFTFELLQSLQVIRVFKVFQYANVLDGLMVIMLTIRACLKELALLILYLLLAMFLFSTLISFVELSGESGTGIPDVLHGYWWAIITMTTVGYGDFYPTTTVGYLIGIMCAVTGIIMTALPVAVIGSNFDRYWQHNKKRQAALKASINQIRQQDEPNCWEEKYDNFGLN